jgi:D-3-phosphoglycerate dehydrogenase
MMKKILISPSSFAECSSAPMEVLERAGFEAVINPYKRRLTSQEVLALAKDCIGIIAGVEALDRDTLSRLKALKIISRVGSGMENIDLKAAHELGIIIKNTPNAPVQAVAELTVALIMNLLRNISAMDKSLHTGKWEKRMGSLLSGKTVGIIGTGKIGKRAAELLSGLGAKVIAYDIKPDASWAGKHNVELRQFDDLLTDSDIITIHASCDKTLIGKREFSTMKKGSYLINVSRGAVVDEGALFDALRDGALSGAALDVFCKEPYAGPLTQLDNVIITPHIGSYARECRIAMEMEAVNNLLGGLKESQGK